MAIYVHTQLCTCTEYVQYRIYLTFMKDKEIIGHFVLGKKCPTVRKKVGQLFEYPDGQGQNVHNPTVRPSPSGPRLAWENLEFRSYIIYVILQGPQISYHIRAKWTRVSPV